MVLLTADDTVLFEIQSWRLINNKWTMMRTDARKFSRGMSIQAIGKGLLQCSDTIRKETIITASVLHFVHTPMP